MTLVLAEMETILPLRWAQQGLATCPTASALGSCRLKQGKTTAAAEIVHRKRLYVAQMIRFLVLEECGHRQKMLVKTRYSVFAEMHGCFDLDLRPRTAHLSYRFATDSCWPTPGLDLALVVLEQVKVGPQLVVGQFAGINPQYAALFEQGS